MNDTVIDYLLLDMVHRTWSVVIGFHLTVHIIYQIKRFRRSLELYSREISLQDSQGIDPVVHGPRLIKYVFFSIPILFKHAGAEAVVDDKGILYFFAF